MNTENLSTSPIAADLNLLQVAIALACGRCGYDLRGLAADGDCPECGEPIRLTIIEIVDPASRRLEPIHKPIVVGNSLAGVVFFYFISFLLSVLTLLAYVPEMIPILAISKYTDTSVLAFGSACCGLLALLCLLPLFQTCKQEKLGGCHAGIVLVGVGLSVWTISMILIPIFLPDSKSILQPTAILFDTVIPVLAAGFVLSGFRKLIPRLGQRSRAFRYAQSSRQRMNDLLATFIVVVLGRTLVATSTPSSNFSFLGTIVMVMSISLIVIGLAYLLRNTLWIRRALITPPPALSELLRSSES